MVGVMAPTRILERNVRPARVPRSESVGGFEEAEQASHSENYLEELSDDSALEDDDGGSHGEIGESDGDRNVEAEIGNVSFGALKDALSRKRKRGSDTTAEQEEKLEAIRARLNEIKSAGNKKGTEAKRERSKSKAVASALAKDSVTINSSMEQNAGQEDDHGFDSDSAPSEEDVPSKSRTSKHAPASQSSKHQVTRKRTVVDAPKRRSRDPRFDATHQHSAHPGNSEKAYSFLRDYQKDEIAELRSAIKAARNEDDKEMLKRKVHSMENRIKSQEAKEREQEVVKRHRKEEKEKVEQGKRPFHLKRKDVKEQALVEKFKGMKSKDREKLMEKRRRKEGQKEKKRMPEVRRVAG